jgi:hypothetical protein
MASSNALHFDWLRRAVLAGALLSPLAYGIPAFSGSDDYSGCSSSEDCDDGVFCNGAENCLDGACTEGVPACEEGQVCNEEADLCLGVAPNPGLTPEIEAAGDLDPEGDSADGQPLQPIDFDCTD